MFVTDFIGKEVTDIWYDKIYHMQCCSNIGKNLTKLPINWDNISVVRNQAEHAFVWSNVFVITDQKS